MDIIVQASTLRKTLNYVILNLKTNKTSSQPSRER